MKTSTPPLIDRSGRRPVIDYLTKDFEGFRQGMLNQIPLLLPNWTSRSESDFGVVLIELFAYVADLLSYYQDRIANEAYLATATQRRSVTELLRLIQYQVKPGLAASAFIHFAVTADIDVGSANLPYRLKTAGKPGQLDRIFEIGDAFSLKARNSSIALSVADLPEGSTAIAMSHARHALGVGDSIYFEEATRFPDGTPRIRRSPMLKVVSVTALPQGEDSISWLPPLPEDYDPAVTHLKGNNVAATEGETISNEPPTIGDGTPAQEMTLSRGPVTHLLRADPFRQLAARAELQVRIDGQLWDQVDSLSRSGPSDRHYFTTVDENDALTVHFGTGTRGAVPPAGGPIVATYRIGLGAQGNVGPDSLTIPLTSVIGVAGVTNPFSATGGANRESTEEAKISGPGSVIAQERAVTLQDYEFLASAFPGVGKTKARVGLRGGYKVVQVFISPENPTETPPPFASSDLRDALKSYLEARQPVNRMAGVDVLNPVYVPVDISVEVYSNAQASASKVAADVRAVLRDLLSFPQRSFGQPIRVGEVFSALHPVSGVAYVLVKRLARSSEAGRPTPGSELTDVSIAENELAYEGLFTVNVFGGMA